MKLSDTNKTLVNITKIKFKINAIKNGSFFPFLFLYEAIHTKIPFTIPQTIKFHPAPCQKPETKNVSGFY